MRHRQRAARRPATTSRPESTTVEPRSAVAGNRAVGAALQAKLVVGSAGDALEREADEVAGQVVRSMSSRTIDRQAVDDEDELQTTRIQREELEDEELLQAKPIHRQELEDEELLQAKPIHRQTVEEEELRAQPQDRSIGPEGGDLDQSTEGAIERARTGGAPLAAPLRGEMETAFDADFSDVRVHTGSSVDRLNESIQSRAFTTGSHVFVRRGDFNPGSAEGRRLIAHELTHVVQQGAARQAPIRRFPTKVLRPGYENWQRKTSDVSVAAEGAAGGVYFLDSRSGPYRRVVVKPMMDEGPEQSQFGDAFLRAMDIEVPASKIVERGSAEFTQLETLIRPHWPGQPVDLSLTNQWAHMTQPEKDANLAAVATWRPIDQLPAFKVMGLARGESLSALAGGGRAARDRGGVAQADVDRVLRLLRSADFLRRLGEVMVADAAIGNDDRMSYGAAVKVNLGNIMVDDNDDISAIDTAAALKRVDAKNAFDPTAFTAATLLRSMITPQRLTAITNAFFQAVADKVGASQGHQGFDPTGYFANNFGNPEKATARGYIQGGINSGLLRLGNLLQQQELRERRTGLKASAAEQYAAGQNKADWKTLKANYAYFEAFRAPAADEAAARLAGQTAGQATLVQKQYLKPWRLKIDTAAASSAPALSWKSEGKHKWLKKGLAAYPPLLQRRLHVFTSIVGEMPTIRQEAGQGPATQQAVRQQQLAYLQAQLPPQRVEAVAADFQTGWNELRALLAGGKWAGQRAEIGQLHQQFANAAAGLRNVVAVG